MSPLPSDDAARVGRVGAPVTASRPGFQEYLEVFLRWKWLALGVFAGVLGLAALSIVRTTPVYEAHATLMITSSNEGNILNQSGGFFLPSTPNTANYTDLLRSRSLAELVAAQLPDSLKLTAGAVQGMLSARAGRESDLIQLTAAAASAATAVAVVNTYLEAFQRYDLERNRTDVSAVRQFVDDQLALVGTRLDSSEKTLAQFKRSRRLTDLGDETRTLVERQSQLAASYEQAAIDAKGSQAQLAFVQNRIEQEGSGMADKIASPLVSNLKATLNQLEVQKANLMIQGFGETSERVLGLDRQIDSTRERLRAETQALIAQQGFVDPVGRLSGLFESSVTLNSGLAASKARQEALAGALATHDAALDRLPETERVLARLTRDVETDRRVFALLSERREEAHIQEVGRVSSVRIIDHARGAGKTKPDVPRSAGSGLMLALALAFGAVWVADRLDSSVRTPEEMARRGFPVLAGIPRLGARGSRRRHDELTSHLLTHADATASDAEAFRMLRTNLAFSAVDRPLKTIMVTSAVPGEGKSTVAVNLAAVLAQAGSRVLLVDADLRHPVLHGVFKQERKPGLTDLILSGGGGDEFFAPTPIHPLFFLAGGTTPPSPADLLLAPATRKLIDRLAGEFDYVVFDTPPALIAADTPILCSQVDATIVVARAGKTSVQAIENTRSTLLNAGARLAGFVLNGIEPGGRYGRNYYYYHKYHYYARTAAAGPDQTKEKR